jgi:hypothetical protein
MTWVAAAIGGSAVLGYLGSQNQASAAQSAAQTQLQGTQYAADIQKQMFDILNKQQEPYRQLGQVGLTQIQNMLPYFTKQPTAEDVQGMPGYKFGLEQGLGSVSQAANVASPGSNVDLARQKFSTDYLTQQMFPLYQATQSNIFNRLASIAGLGQTATQQSGQLGSAAGSNLAQLAVGGANALAGGQVGAANAQAAGLSGLGNAGMMYALMRGGGGGGGTAMGNLINSGYYGQFGITPDNASIAI